MNFGVTVAKNYTGFIILLLKSDNQFLYGAGSNNTDGTIVFVKIDKNTLNIATLSRSQIQWSYGLTSMIISSDAVSSISVLFHLQIDLFHDFYG